MSEADAEHALERFRPLVLAKGALVVDESVEDPTLMVVTSGELEAHSGGTLLGRIGAGELIGEMALFAGATRSASVTARTRCELLALGWDGYDGLRRSGHPAASVIERAALSGLGRRLASTRARIADMAHDASPALRRSAVSWVDCLGAAWGRLGLGRQSRPDRVAVLSRSPLFAGVPGEALATLARRFRVGVWPRGARLFSATEPRPRLWLVASGSVELVLADNDLSQQHLATLGGGHAVGVSGLAGPGDGPPVACLVRRRVVALTLLASAWHDLVDRSDAVGSAFRVAMIRAVAEQLDHANRQLVALDAGDPGAPAGDGSEAAPW